MITYWPLLRIENKGRVCKMKLLCQILQKRFSHLKELSIQNVVMDSRKVVAGSLFFAMQNGNRYVSEALEKGACIVIADHYSESHERVISVKDTVLFMQELAAEYRSFLKTKLIAITGSNGKTTTKDIVYAILSKTFPTKKTLGNYNNHIGLPFTILNLEEGDEFAVLEMGMSSFGEIDALGKIARPDYGIITNIGDSHLEFLKTRENVFKAKTELLPYLPQGRFITSGDDIFLKKVSGVHVGYEEGNDYHIVSYRKKERMTSFQVRGKDYEICLEGKHNVMNAAMGIALAEMIGMKPEEIRRNLSQIELSPMRFERSEYRGTEYINDAYNASPISMFAALDSLEEMKAERKFAVLGDMLELGEREIEFHKEVIQKAMSCHLQAVLLYGTRMKQAFHELHFHEGLYHFESKEAIREYLRKFSEKTVLIKASRGMKLEDIIEGEEK